MKAMLFVALGIVSVGVWAFALIGLVSVAGAIAADPAPPKESSSPLLSPPETQVQATEIDELAPAPGATRTEYRIGRYGDAVVAQAEYVTEADERAVRAYFRETLVRRGWEITEFAETYGEWSLSATGAGRELTIEIEQRKGVTGIEIEMMAPAVDRGRTTDR
jgi:hypothetical protein